VDGDMLLKVPWARFSSADFLVDDRFELWRNTIKSLYDLSPATDRSRGELIVDTTVWNLGGVVITRGVYSAQRLGRSLAVVRHSDLDNYRITLPLQGGAILLDVAGDRRSFGSGTLFVTDLARVDREDVAAGENIILFLNRESVDALLPQPLRMHGFAPRGALASLLRNHLTGLTDVLSRGKVSNATAPALAQATLHLFSAAIRGALPLDEEGKAAVGGALRRCMMRYVDEHLLDPKLSQDSLCRTFRVSRTTLYRLFQTLGGVAAHVQTRRLARIHAVLSEPAHYQHLGRLAEIYGFVSQAHMSKVYRARYGVSPSETRSQGWESGRSEDSHAIAGGAPATQFVRWLQGVSFQ
jgi:AraC-like DNA-binding protein